MELNGSARPVAIEHVVDAALYVDNQRNLDHLESKFFAEIVFDITAKMKNCLLRFLSSQKRGVIPGQNLFELGIVANAGSG